MKPRRGMLPLALALCASAALGASGVVFDDANGDGIRQDGEPGIPGVEVSNGADIAVTAADGTFTIPDRGGHEDFVVKPRGWRLEEDALHLPRFHAKSGQASPLAFALRRAEEPDDVRVLVLSDPQPATPEEVGYLSKGVIGRMPPGIGAAFGVTLGDIVYDRPDLFGDVNRAVAAAGLPWFNLPGNHDVALGTPDEARAAAPYEAVYGPSSYAFHWGNALFVALDDVRPLGGPRYIGGLREDQFALLSGLLKRSPPSEWVVLMMHIPMFSPDPLMTEGFRTADRLRLFSLLKGRERVFVLSGHTHYQRHVAYGAADGWEGPRPIRDYNVAAACGGFWGGPKDADGIPVSTMWDGTPPGYAVVEFHGDQVSTDYYPARLPAGRQISLHVPAVVAPRQGYVSFYANVFNGDDRWTVEARADDRGWLAPKRILGWDPTYTQAFLAQDLSGTPEAGKRLPDPAVCYHLWRGSLPADLAVGRHVLQVRATDPDGKTFTAEAAFEIARP